MDQVAKKRRKSARAWSDEELAILAEQWKNGKPIRLWMDLLPKRTERAINNLGQALHGPRGNTHTAGASVSWRLICRALADGAMLTPLEISERSGVSRRQVYVELKMHHGTEAHIGGYGERPQNGYWPALWKLGPGKDAKRPKAMTVSERAKRRWRRLKEERPDYIMARTLKQRLRDAEKRGKLIRPDPAAAWMFGAAA
ncbi:hypothetical protein NDR89_20010 [Cupriavidus gilardii]|uniref:Helix-turn-helix domain-containing protein n=1 Tax=Cupriavidus gilardii TaxID=82541 RepID=A0ABY4VU92_9BURK|nr:hypothetical protein [Cupriavidus gilardii]USE78923.1 hypothetical protein NDR89_20010 [Cupriavidus gilardii]